MTLPYLYVAKIKDYILTVLSNIEEMLRRDLAQDDIDNIRLLLLTRLPIIKPIGYISFENLQRIFLEHLSSGFEAHLLKDLTERYSTLSLDKNNVLLSVREDLQIDVEACSTGELIAMLLSTALNICESLIKIDQDSYNCYIVIDDIFYGLTYKDLSEIIKQFFSKIYENYYRKVIILTHRIELFHDQVMRGFFDKIYIFSRGFSKLENYVWSRYGEYLGRFSKNVIIDLDVDNVSDIVKSEIWEEPKKEEVSNK